VRVRGRSRSVIRYCVALRDKYYLIGPGGDQTPPAPVPEEEAAEGDGCDDRFPAPALGGFGTSELGEGDHRDRRGAAATAAEGRHLPLGLFAIRRLLCADVA